MLELHAIRNLGQWVYASEIADALLDLLAIVDVLRCENRGMNLAFVVGDFRARVGHADRRSVLASESRFSRSRPV